MLHIIRKRSPLVKSFTLQIQSFLIVHRVKSSDNRRKPGRAQDNPINTRQPSTTRLTQTGHPSAKPVFLPLNTHCTATRRQPEKVAGFRVAFHKWIKERSGRSSRSR